MPRTADDDARALAHRDVNAATETNGDAMCDAAMKPNDEKDARDDDAGADDDGTDDRSRLEKIGSPDA